MMCTERTEIDIREWTIREPIVSDVEETGHSPNGYVLLTAHITELDRDLLTAVETVDAYGGRVLVAGNDGEVLERGWASSTLTAEIQCHWTATRVAPPSVSSTRTVGSDATSRAGTSAARRRRSAGSRFRAST